MSALIKWFSVAQLTVGFKSTQRSAAFITHFAQLTLKYTGIQKPICLSAVKGYNKFKHDEHGNINWRFILNAHNYTPVNRRTLMQVKPHLKPNA